MTKSPKSKAKTVAKINITKLTTADIDKLGEGALREALKSVVRAGPNPASSHKDHNSHSNTNTD